LTTLKRIFPILLLTIAFLAWTTPAIAQDPTPTPTETASPQPGSGAIYIIQPGDTLYALAIVFNVTLADLIAANSSIDANNISVGEKIIIPGLEGVDGILDKKPVLYGDTLHSISRRNQVPEDLLRRLNYITSPSELFAGKQLIYPLKDNFTPFTNRISLAPGQTLLEASILAQSDPSTLVALNGLKGDWEALPGDILYAPGEAPAGTGPNGMPAGLLSIEVSPLPMKQGGTASIIVETAPGITLGGNLAYQPLHFFPLEDGKQVALQGIHAMLDPGPYVLTLEVTQQDGTKQTFEQMVIIQPGYYPEDPILTVEPATIDPAVNDPELQKITDLTAPTSPQKLWQGSFKNPSIFPDCFTSRYGNRRTYLGQGTSEKFYSFHSGLDFCGGIGLQISAPADGVVIFAGPLTVRGNATIIDHGWGVYSGIWHQSEIDVQVGQTVKAGDVIGLVGGTGRVTGAHLHWEVWVNGIQVDPMDWMENNYP
jgi:murein DD-endopeptidase MepM/ murein hydrolase activator NlpD